MTTRSPGLPSWGTTIVRAGMAVLLAGFLFFGLGKAWAWNSAGHRLTAAIAWSEMTPVARQQVTTLLGHHPALSDWEKQLSRGKNPPGITPLAIFAEASTWPDDIRRDRRFAETADDGAAKHRDWHYVNWPLDGGAAGKGQGGPGGSGESRGGQLDLQLARQLSLLADRQRPASERAIALSWLAHLLADAHQPLHVASVPQADGSYDDGGRAIMLRDDSHPRHNEISLHSWWDDLPGGPWLRGNYLLSRASALREAQSTRQIESGNPRQWIAESFVLAKSVVLPPLAPPGIPWLISNEYRARATEISARRLLEAGVRLGRLLNTTLDAP